MYRISKKVKRNLLLFFTGLFVAYVRLAVQYGQYLWDSFSDFLISWILHYFLVLLVLMFSYACIKLTEKIFLGYKESEEGLSVDDATVYLSMTLIVLALLIFISAHTPVHDLYLYE